MAINGAPAALLVGGAVASGPAAGIYHIKVADAATGESNNDNKTPYLELQFEVHEDPDNAAKEGKKLVKQRYYLGGEKHDEEKKKVMLGMMKRGPYAGFNIPWPKEAKKLDARIFVGKTAWVLLGAKKKQNETDDDYMEVKRIAQDKAKLESTKEAVENTDGGKSTVVKEKAPASRR